ncbi:DNase [Nanoarchaeota archaeon]|nr:MAG: DNase [Nanoarchaeota archaeon]
MIDVHCHLNDEAFDEDREDVVKRAKEKGITIIDSGTSYEEDLKSLEISGKYDNVHSTLGFDPLIADVEEAKRIIELLRERKRDVVGVGEVGLDYYEKNKEKRKVQAEIFEMFIDLSKELKLPLVVHSRWAPKQVLEILEEKGAKSVVLHAFPGNEKEAKRAIEDGYFISIPTSVLYSKQKQLMAKIVPLKNMVLETDSPIFWKGRNEPVNVIRAAEEIARIRGIDLNEVIDWTTRNARKVFKID